MKSAKNLVIVLVTAPDRPVARKLAKSALEAHLIACANLVPGVESHYRWQGDLEEAAEVLVLLKTVRSRLKALEQLVLELHPYDTPEFVVLDVDKAAAKYGKWWQDSVG